MRLSIGKVSKYLKEKYVPLSILIKHESCLSVCLSVHVFLSHQKSQLHEILALGLIWANLKHDEARFSKFSFLRGVPVVSSVNFDPL